VSVASVVPVAAVVVDVSVAVSSVSAAVVVVVEVKPLPGLVGEDPEKPVSPLSSPLHAVNRRAARARWRGLFGEK
jgi:hypothetical protein